MMKKKKDKWVKYNQEINDYIKNHPEQLVHEQLIGMLEIAGKYKFNIKRRRKNAK